MQPWCCPLNAHPAGTKPLNYISLRYIISLIKCLFKSSHQQWVWPWSNISPQGFPLPLNAVRLMVFPPPASVFVTPGTNWPPDFVYMFPGCSFIHPLTPEAGPRCPTGTGVQDLCPTLALTLKGRANCGFVWARSGQLCYQQKIIVILQIAPKTNSKKLKLQLKIKRETVTQARLITLIIWDFNPLTLAPLIKNNNLQGQNRWKRRCRAVTDYRCCLSKWISRYAGADRHLWRAVQACRRHYCRLTAHKSLSTTVIIMWGYTWFFHQGTPPPSSQIPTHPTHLTEHNSWPTVACSKQRRRGPGHRDRRSGPLPAPTPWTPCCALHRLLSS